MGKEVEAGTRSSELIHATVLWDAWQDADIGVVLFDDSGRYHATNRAYLTMTGRTRAGTERLRAGHNLADDPESRARFVEIIKGDLSHGRATIERADGESLEVDYLVTPTTVAGLPHFIGLMWPAGAARKTS